MSTYRLLFDALMTSIASGFSFIGSEEFVSAYRIAFLSTSSTPLQVRVERRRHCKEYYLRYLHAPSAFVGTETRGLDVIMKCDLIWIYLLAGAMAAFGDRILFRPLHEQFDHLKR